MSNLFPPVAGYRDGLDKLGADDMNRPINALTRRTDYLKSQLDVITGAGTFESVRLTGVQLSTTTPPTVNSFVYLDPTNNRLAPAIAEAMPSAVDNYASATLAAYSIGLLVAIAGGTGTVVTYGRFSLTGILLTSLLETGEVFRDGPYFLSTTQAGRMTANPKGPAIYLGYFLEDKGSPGYGDFALLAPQLKDIWQAHLHYNFPLYSQPAGDNAFTGTTPADTAYVRGIKPDDYQPGGPQAGNEPPIRALVIGDWTGTGTVTYTVWVTTTGDTMASALVHWSTNDDSDDPVGGATGVRLAAYNQPVAIGGKGLYFVLEMGGAFADYLTIDNFDALVTTTIPVTERQWTVAVPSRVRGWLPKWVRVRSSYTGSTPTTETLGALYLFGRFQNPDRRAFDDISIEVTNAGGHFSAGTVNLAVKDRYGATICTFAGVGFGGPAKHVVNAGDWALWLVVSKYDATGAAIVNSVGGLQVTDKWLCNFQDEAPGAAFEYAAAFDPSLAAYYPPRPLGAVVLEVNGVMEDPRDRFQTDEGTYLAGPRTLYWYNDGYGQTPFPRDWQTPALVGSPMYGVNAMLYFTHLAMAGSRLVTSLQPYPGSPIEILDMLTGQPATTGDLQVKADLAVLVDDVNRTGYLAAKGAGTNGHLQTGPLVEKIVAGGGIAVQTVDGAPAGQGTVRVSFTGDGLLTDNFDEITLLNAKQEVVPDKLFSFIKLLEWDSGSGSNIDTAFLAQLRVPPSLTGNYRCLLYFTVFGLDGIALGINAQNKQWAGLTLTYSMIRDYSLAGLPAYVDDSLLAANQVVYPLPDDVAFGRLAGSSIPALAYRAYDPIVLHNDASLAAIEGQLVGPFMPTGIPTPADVSGGTFSLLTGGDILALRLQRSSPAVAHQSGNQEYKAAVGFINLRWKLLEV
jgi:hypothetical protein